MGVSPDKAQPPVTLRSWVETSASMKWRKPISIGSSLSTRICESPGSLPNRRRVVAFANFASSTSCESTMLHGITKSLGKAAGGESRPGKVKALFLNSNPKCISQAHKHQASGHSRKGMVHTWHGTRISNAAHGTKQVVVHGNLRTDVPSKLVL
jgi:hypothetical protein